MSCPAWARAGRGDRICDMGVPRLSPGDAVDAFEEAIVLVKTLCGGAPPVTHRGRRYLVSEIDPAPVAAPAVLGPVAGSGRHGAERPGSGSSSTVIAAEV